MVLAGCLLEEIPNEDEYWTKDVEKMSLMFNSIKEIPDGMSPNCPKLSTLLLRENLFLKFIADSFFSHMHGLCVLDLSHSLEIINLPNSLSDLESLKTLLLGGCRNLVNVPYLGKLKALKELGLSYTAIREAPQGMNELVNLKFLSMDNTFYLNILPTGLLLNFSYLQCLRLPDQIQASNLEIESLRKLKEFKGRVNNVADFNRLVGSLGKYCIIVGSPEDNSPSHSEFDGYNAVTVVGCNYQMEYDAVLLAHDAQCLKLDKCVGLSKSLFDDFPKFNNPNSLNTLEVINCEGVECILAKKGELQSHVAPPLQTLEKIQLRELLDFVGIIEKQELVLPAQAVFSSLRELVIENCHKMKNLVLTGSEFPKLERIRIVCCREIEEIIDQESVVSFPKLQLLELVDLPKLMHVGTTSICDSIEFIIIFGCGALKKLPLYFPVVDGGESSNNSYSPPPTLKEIWIPKEIWESLEWEHPSYKHILQPYLKI